MERREMVRSLVAEILATHCTVEDACSDNPELQEAVRQKLLEVQLLERQLDTLFPPTPVFPDAQAWLPEWNLAELPQIEGYEVESVLGRGGMGIVYRARHLKLNRLVALKMLISGAFASPSELKRFTREVKAEAQLQHPHIVQVYDVGEVGGRPYFTMEYLEGGTLAQKLAGAPQSAADSAQTVITLAAAVHTAHQKGIVHRDLKPTNVLLTSDGQPKISDFGLAHQGNAETQLTLHGDRLGTPSYMAPEQALGQVDQVGPTSDVYSLGAILYELLTGRPPFRANSAAATERQVVMDEPVPPARLNSQVPRALETICLMCLRKEPARRYASAAELAADLQRFLRQEPIHAKPISLVDRLGHWIRRNRSLAASLFAVAALVLLLLVGSLTATFHFRNLESEQRALALEKSRLADENGSLARRYEQERQNALDGQRREEKLHAQSEERGASLRRNLYAAEMNLCAQAAASPSGIGRVSEWLQPWQDSKPDQRGWEWYYLNGLCHRDLCTIPVSTSGVWRVAASPDGRQLATAGDDSFVSIFDVASRKQTHKLTGHDRLVCSVAWSPDGSQVASSSWDGTVKIWNRASGDVLRTLSGDAARLFSVSWNQDGTMLAAGSDDTTVWIWDAKTGNVLHRLKGHTDGVIGLAWHPRENRLASSSRDATVRVWNLGDPEHSLVFTGHKNWVHNVAWHPEGSRIASVSNDQTCKIWEAAGGSELLTYTGHGHGIVFARWSSDGTELATGGEDNTIHLWNAADGRRRAVLRGHTAVVTSVVWSAQDKQLVSSGLDGTIKFWDAATRGETPRIGVYDGVVTDLAWSPNGQRLATAGSNGPLKLFDAQGQYLLTLSSGQEGFFRSIAWSSNSKLLAACGHHSIVHVWDAKTGAEVHALSGLTRPIPSLAWSQHGVLAASDQTGKVCFWNTDRGELVRTLHDPRMFAYSLAWSPDDRRLASACDDGSVRVYDSETYEQLWSVRAHTSAANSVAWSSDGKWIASAGSDHVIQIWDAATGARQQLLRGHTHAVLRIIWHPNGNRLASASTDRSVRVWDFATSKPTLAFLDYASPMTTVSWSPDGETLAAGSEDGTIAIYDAAAGFKTIHETAGVQ